MYLPRLRGRQFEISAIRSCAQSFAARGRVVPIIELVKSPDDLLARRLDSISDQGLSCGLVLNPSVGEMKGSTGWQALGTFLLDRNLLDSHGLVVLSNGSADHGAMARWIGRARKKRTFTLDVFHEPDMSISLSGNTYRDVRWNIAEDRTVPSSYGLPLGSRPVIWSSDPFPGLQPNSEYLVRPESIFTTRTSAYKSAGYAGISDFLTVGRSFKPGGGRAYAVVIHLTFKKAGAIRVRHFCSDTNDTPDDPGGKFLEALEKLVAFVTSSGIPSNPAIDTFADLHNRAHFPGLGKVMELSMINHMLVMQSAV